MAIGNVGECLISMTATTRQVVLDSLAIVEASAPGVFHVEPMVDVAIQPGATLGVRVTATPTALGPATAALAVDAHSDVPLAFDLPLAVIGAPAPSCFARVRSVNDVEIAPGAIPFIKPLDNVIVAVEGTPGSADGAIDSFEWAVLGRPVGSTVQLTTPTSWLTGFTFDNDLGLDLAGTYELRASVRDSSGFVAECLLTLEAEPGDALLVQLSWDMSQADLDLHLRRDADTLCSASDCYAATCANGGVVWGDEAHSPRLFDDLDGFGPESLALDVIADGRYLLAVHGRDVATASVATVRVFVEGSLLAEYSSALGDDELWRVGALDCIAGACAPVDDGAVEPLATCAP